MNDTIDEGGNNSMDFEKAASDITNMFMADEAPVEEVKEQLESKKIEAKEEAPEAEATTEEDELDSILAGLEDDDEEETEAGDQEKEEEAEEDSSEEPEEGNDTLHKVKIDGEEHEVSLAELKKGYGLQQSLTRKGQELAETRKQLDEEAQAVAWAKAKPEVRELSQQINEAQEAVNRGFTFNEHGEQVRLTQQQIEQTKKNIEDAQGKLMGMTQPPRLEDLYEAIPAFKDPGSPENAATIKPFFDTLSEFGYTQAELASENDPRTFLMLKELHAGREAIALLEKAKARRKDKAPATASKVTKSAKPATSSNSTSGTSEPTKRVTIEQVNNGETDVSDLFMDI